MRSHALHSRRARVGRYRPAAVAVALLAFVALAGAGGCMVTPLQPRLTGEVVVTAPPPPRVEVVRAAPVPGYVWIPGYWGWAGGRHVWVDGRWEAPRSGYRWEPHVWVRAGDGWRLREGHWVRG